MKTNLLITIFLCVFLVSFSIAQVPADQDTIVVEGGQLNIGSLETAINTDTTATGERVNKDRVYKLKASTIYFQQSPILYADSTGTLTIVGEKGGKKPVVVLVPKGDVSPGRNDVIGSLTIKNIYYHNADVFGTRAWVRWRINTNNQQLRVEDCVFEFCNGLVFDCNPVSQGFSIWLKNSYFRDLEWTAQWWNARVYQAKVPIDTCWIENVTVTNSGLPFLMQEQPCKFMYFSHNTVINVKKYQNLNPYYEEAYITNNLFVNCNMFGECINIYGGGGQHPDAVFMGVVNIDTLENELYGGAWWSPSVALPMEDTKIFIADNIHWVNKLLDHYYNGEYNDVGDYPISNLGWEVEGIVEVENVPPIFLNDITKGLIAAYGNIVAQNNYDNDTDPKLVTPSIASKDVVDSLAMFTRRLYGVSEDQEAGPAWVFGDYDPATVPGVETEEGNGIFKMSDFVEDFTYTADIKSTIDGRPIGALHWWDGEMDTWDSYAELQKVKDAYEDAVTAVEKQHSKIPEAFDLSQNYPNPFNPVTTIEFSIMKKGHVNLTIFNQLGQQVTTLVDKNMSAGAYKMTWDASDIPSGLYFYTIQSGDQKMTRKMILIK